MRILFVLPELPHPPFTGAHTRPLTLLRAAARTHEVAVVGAAPPEADLSLLEELCAEVRMAPAGAARPARRRTMAAGRRLVTPVPLVSSGRSKAVAALVDELAASWKPDAMLVETLYAAHYRVPDVPLIVDLPDVPSGLCESAAAARARALPRRQPPGGHQPALRAPPAGRRGAHQHQRRRPRTPGHARHRVLHHPPGDRPAARGSHLRTRVDARDTTWPCGCSSSGPSSTRRTATRPGGWCARWRPSCAASACRSPWSSPACWRRRGCASRRRRRHRDLRRARSGPAVPQRRHRARASAPRRRHQEQDARGDGLGPAGDRHAAGVHRPPAAGRRGVRGRAARPGARGRADRRAARRSRAAPAPRPGRPPLGGRGSRPGARRRARRRRSSTR